MIFKQSTQTIWLVIALWICLWLGIGQTSIIAATLTEPGVISQERMQTLPAHSLNLESGIDHFLTSMPVGFYTIASIEGLKSLLADHQIMLVDVREPSEYRLGHIPNAINIPLRTLAHTPDKIVRDRPVVLYCSSGYRSAMGVMTLHLLGYDNVQGFPLSFVGWKTAGEAIVKS